MRPTLTSLARFAKKNRSIVVCTGREAIAQTKDGIQIRIPFPSVPAAIRPEDLLLVKNPRVEERDGSIILTDGTAIVRPVPAQSQDFSPEPFLSSPETVHISNKMIDAMNRASSACSRDEMRLQLHGVLLDGARALGTDGHRLHAMSIPYGSTETPVYVPESILPWLSEGSIKHGTYDGRQTAVFSAYDDSATIFWRNDRMFPDWRKVVPGMDSYHFHYRVDVTAMLASLAAVPKPAGKDKLRAISFGSRIKMETTDVTFNVETPGHGTWTRETRLNADYLADAIESLGERGGGMLSIYGQDREDCGPVRLCNDAGGFALIMPLRV